MKLSLITVVFNGERYIADCIQSVLSQDYPNIEYIVIDGGSTDSTLSILEKFKANISILRSEKDKGMYDALNKGIALATGDIIGVLHADDMLASSTVLSEVVRCFEQQNADAVYGNLNYITNDGTNQLVRKWKSKPYSLQMMQWGWMPAHPTLYIKKAVFDQFGNYSLDFGTAADYELILRFLYRHQIKAVFLDQLIVNMRVGGMSNASMNQRMKAFFNDYKAIKTHEVPRGWLTLFWKKMSKLSQYFSS